MANFLTDKAVQELTETFFQQRLTQEFPNQ